MQHVMAPHADLGDTEIWRHVRRLRSANVALAVGVVTAVATQVASDSPIGYVGIPIAGAVGWILAPQLGGADARTVAAILRMALACAVLGAYGVALMTSTGLSWGALAIGTFGVLFFGLPAFRAPPRPGDGMGCHHLLARAPRHSNMTAPAASAAKMPSDPRGAGRARRMGLAMAAIIAGYGLFVAAIPFLQGDRDPTPPWAIYRPIALAGLFAIPAIVAAIGAVRNVRPLLIAAGVLCLLQAFVALSGVTLGLVVPAIVLLWLGAAPGAAWARPDKVARLAGASIIILTIAAWVSLLAFTEPRCYVITRAADGTLAYTEVPATDAMVKGPTQISIEIGADGHQQPDEGGGCGSAELTLRGVGVSTVLAIGAIVVAASVARGGSRLDPA